MEDHPDTARAMNRLLKSLGYEVRLADTVASALQAADAEWFDVVVSDIGLPDGSGLDLMQQLEMKHLMKSIALSGFRMQEDIQKSKDAGFASHLTKPIDVAVLEKMLRELRG